MTVYVQSSLKLQFAFHSVLESELHWRLKMTDSSMDYNQGLTDPSRFVLGPGSSTDWCWTVVSPSLTMKPIKHRYWWRISTKIDFHHSQKVTKISYMWPCCHQHSCLNETSTSLWSFSTVTLYFHFQFFQVLWISLFRKKVAIVKKSDDFFDLRGGKWGCFKGMIIKHVSLYATTVMICS